MKKSSRNCGTLSEYRREILKLRQTEIASRVERGHLPAPWSRQDLLRAYGLTEEEFERMVKGAAKCRDLTPAAFAERFLIENNFPEPRHTELYGLGVELVKVLDLSVRSESFANVKRARA